MNELKGKFGTDMGQQFTPPRCFELTGRKLLLRFDGFEATAEFIDDDRIAWVTGTGREERNYWCLKSSERVYLVSFGSAGKRCVTLILDLDAGLVTIDITAFDENNSPYKETVDFGVISGYYKAVPDTMPAAERHGFTNDLDGNRFLWIFCDTYWHVESYSDGICTHLCNYPAFNGSGPYQCVKITDTQYYVINGDPKESICMIYNLKNLTSVGRSVVFETAEAPIGQGAVGKYSETVEVPDDVTVIDTEKSARQAIAFQENA